MRSRLAASHLHPDDLRGVSRLIIDAICGITSMAEVTHANVRSIPVVGRRGAGERSGGLSGFVYGAVRVTTRGVGHLLDAALAATGKFLPPLGSTRARNRVLSLINGVFGDHLESTANPLAISMTFCVAGRPLVLTGESLARALPSLTGKIVVFVHGLCLNDAHWQHDGICYGEMLGHEGYTPVYLRYNTGRHLSQNGEDFSRILDQLVHSWPIAIERLVIVGHSMGGLISRSACEIARENRASWLRQLDVLVFLGSPHLGSPLERWGNWVNVVLGMSRYTTAFGKLARIRSAGITDLRFGALCHTDWMGRDRFARATPQPRHVALPENVACYAIAGAIAKDETDKRRLVGDGLVSVASALGHDTTHRRDLGIPAHRQWIAYGTRHITLLGHPQIAAQLKRWVVDVTSSPG